MQQSGFQNHITRRLDERKLDFDYGTLKSNSSCVERLSAGEKLLLQSEVKAMENSYCQDEWITCSAMEPRPSSGAGTRVTIRFVNAIAIHARVASALINV